MSEQLVVTKVEWKAASGKDVERKSRWERRRVESSSWCVASATRQATASSVRGRIACALAKQMPRWCQQTVPRAVKCRAEGRLHTAGGTGAAPRCRTAAACVACCVSPLHPWTPRLVAAPDHVFALPTSFKVISHPCGTLPRPAPAPSLKWLLQLQSSSSWKTTGATAASTMCFRLLKSIISCAANGHSRA